MFSGRHSLPKVNGKIFVDRNPQTFMTVLDYLRNNLRLPKITDEKEQDLVNMELIFWGLTVPKETYVCQI